MAKDKPKPGKRAGKTPAGQPAAPPGMDSRFSAMLTDPRFQRFPKKRQQVAIDERFAGMFEDPDFATKAVVDKRGRKVVNQRKGDELRRYYRLKDEDDDKEDNAEGGTASAAPAKVAEAAASAPAGRTQKQKQKRVHQQQQEAELEGAEEPDEQQPVQPKQPKGQHRQQQQQQQQRRQHRQAAEEDSNEGVDDDEAEAKLRWARARGLADVSSSSDEDDEEAGSASDASLQSDEEEGEEGSEDLAAEMYEGSDELDEMDPQEWGVGALAANPEEPIPQGEETRRLAVVDLDWQHTSAVDILAVLRPFLPRDGRIERVTVYPSDYGLERMAQEAVAGPQGLFASKADQDAANGADASSLSGDEEESGDEEQFEPENSDSEGVEEDSSGDGEAASSSDDGGDGSSDEGDAAGRRSRGGRSGVNGKGGSNGMAAAAAAAVAGSSSDDDDGPEDSDTVRARVRMYERSRLRYYYAVVEFDSAASATRVYEECDGLEMEGSGCKLDLRFVPDEQSFEGRQVRDTVTEVPSNYEPPEFMSNALQHTDAKLTWDADDKKRKKALTRRLTEEELKDADFAAYLASSSSEGEDEDEDEEEQQQEQQEQQGHAKDEGKGQAATQSNGHGVSAKDKYRALLLNGGQPERKGGKSWAAGDEDEEEQEQAGTSGRDAAAAAKQGIRRGRREEASMEMQVTFAPGLQGLGKQLLDKKRDEQAKKAEGVWDAYIRKKKEKAKARRALGRTSKGDSSDSEDYDEAVGAAAAGAGGAKNKSFFEHEEDPFADPFFEDAGPVAPDDDNSEDSDAPLRPKGGKAAKGLNPAGAKAPGDKAARKAAAAADARQKAELELLLLDEGTLRDAAKGVRAPGLAANSGDAGKQGAKVSKKEKRRLKSEARKRARAGSDDEAGEGADGFQADLQDPRFAAMFSSHEYALDPTDPRFAASKGKQGRLQQAAAASKKQRGTAHAAAPPAVAPVAGAARGAADAASMVASGAGVVGQGGQQAREKQELRAMVAKLKRQQQGQQGQQSAAGAKRPKL